MRTPIPAYFLTAGPTFSRKARFSGVSGKLVECFLTDVEPRLDDERHTGFERPLVVADVVDIHADPVADAVRVPRPELRTGRIGDETELEQALFDDGLRRALDVERPRADPRGVHAGILRGEHQLVDLTLRRSEPSAYRIGAGDVAGLSFVVRGRVDEQQIALIHAPRRSGVVQRRRIGSAADNRRISGRHRASRQIDALNRGLDFALEAFRPRGPHARDVRFRGDVDALAQQPLFVRRLDLPQPVHVRREVHDPGAEEPLAGAIREGVSSVSGSLIPGVPSSRSASRAVPSSSARKKPS